jgi:cytosolic carboxypeptidase protein 2/3
VNNALKNNAAINASFFKIIYYGPRFKDSFEMHKSFVKPFENTYEFNFPKFYGIASAKAFYDSFFAEEHGLLDEEKPDDMRAFSGMAPDIEWDELHFNSSFENGNLDMVVRTGEHTYDLFLRADTNTRGHFGWFHFEVSHTHRN